MKRFKRQLAYLLSVVLITCFLLPVNIYAAGGIDLNKDLSLTIVFQDKKDPLVDAEFKIYLVATVDQNGKTTVTEPFKWINIDSWGKDDASWRKLASTLEGYVLRDSITPTDSGKTDSRGSLVFPTFDKKLKPGLYLVLGLRHEEGTYRYDAAPFLMLLPTQDKASNEWIYDVTVSPKYESIGGQKTDTVSRKVLKVWKDDGNETKRPKEIIVQLLRDGEVFDTVTLNAANNWRYAWDDLQNKYKWLVVEKELEDYHVEVTREGITFVVTNTYTDDSPDNPKPPPGPPYLPGTGQLWWPVPILLSVGLLFIVIALIRRRGSSDEKE